MTTKPPRGRPPKYRAEFAEQARRLCLLGLTDLQLAGFFGVNEATLGRWKKAYPDFCMSMKSSKVEADTKVAESLYRRAMGYSHPEEKIFCQEGAIIRAETLRHYPPDTTACFFWLKNRQPKYWRDKVEVQHEGDLRIIPWDAIREISRQQLAVAEERHRTMIEGRAERIGFEPDEDDANNGE